MREVWEEELLAGHRWGRLFQWFKEESDKPAEEHISLKKLWDKAQPIEESSRGVMEQIIALEICNWNLEDSILALCEAIGAKKPAKKGIGHMASVTEERWKKIWAYYFTLRNWLPCETKCGYQTLLKICDPHEAIQNHILSMLGDRNELKELYVERFCLCLERWLGGYPSSDSAQMKTHDAAVSAIEREIKKIDPESQVVHELVLKSDGDGRLNPCNHKAFRRYDLIISSIGAGKWRAAMGRRGTDGFERANTLEKYLSPIELWIHNKGREGEGNELSDKIHKLLGKPDDVKIFLASLLISLLRSQQLAARKLAESRVEKS